MPSQWLVYGEQLFLAGNRSHATEGKPAAEGGRVFFVYYNLM